ncbi:MAG TPA: LLM class flavin-dependent oxidoreductase [Actinomycetes bacterium]|nr:LLM class flavin-dependent oxidoreductase [Actinomycetes bacterium]
MRVGIGLPTTTPGADGSLLAEWARRADAGPFASLGVLDRVVYDSVEPLVALAAAAAVTERIRLVTMVVVGPLRNTVLLAKQAASLDLLSGGRLTLGLAVGARGDDYRATGVAQHDRGRRLDEQLGGLRATWEEGAVGPKPAQPGGPPLLVGGLSGEAFARVARSADGYVHGGGPPRSFAGAAARAWAAWRDLERPARPELWGQGYFALGDAERGAAYLRDYYAFTGPFAERIAAGNLTSARAVKDFVRGYEEAGCDQLVLLPTVADPAQLDRLADVLA